MWDESFNKTYEILTRYGNVVVVVLFLFICSIRVAGCKNALVSCIII